VPTAMSSCPTVAAVVSPTPEVEDIAHHDSAKAATAEQRTRQSLHVVPPQLSNCVVSLHSYLK